MSQPASPPWVASPLAYSLIKQFEGLRLTSYRCPAGFWTIGWGHTSHIGPGLQISEVTAETLLSSDVTNVMIELNRLMPAGVNLTQGMVDALVSLGFNLAGGLGTLPAKAPRLWADLLAGNKPAAADEFLDMDHALVNEKPVVLPGLKARREAEAALFLS